MQKRLLLIDDENDITEITGSLFRFHHFDVASCNNAAEFEALLTKEPYDLVVTDLMMPDVDGFKVISQLRSRAEYKTTPIIALTAKNLTDEERKFLLQNKTHVVLKPFEPLELVEQIKHLLGIS